MDRDLFLATLDRMFKDGRAADVGKYLCDCLAQADADGDFSSALTVLNEMIGYFRSISAHDDAVQASVRALRETDTPELRHSVARGTTLLNAATAYRAAGRAREALPLYQEALAIYEKTLPPGDSRLAGLYNNISSLHTQHGEYEQALELLRKSAAILADTAGEEMETATVGTNLALVLFRLGREAEAKETLDQALAIFDRLREGGKARPSHYASALAALGEAYYTMRRLDQAAAIYKKALAELRFHYGENQDFATTCRNYAVVLDALGKTEQAGEYRKTADRAEERVRGGKAAD